MKLEIVRENLLSPLQAVVGVVERRQTMPILANVLLRVRDNKLWLAATDLEVEMVAHADLDEGLAGATTVAGRKLMDICRSLPESSEIAIAAEGDRLVLKSGGSRFSLATLPADDFPLVDSVDGDLSFQISQAHLKHLIEQTQFAMAHQDVRYYLNGLLFEFRPNKLRAVGTDGHRLSLCDIDMALPDVGVRQVIVPRKGILELQRLLTDDEDQADIEVSHNHIRVNLGSRQFTSKLVDGRFPDYEKVIPPKGARRLVVDRGQFRQALTRAAILSNEKFRGVRLNLSPDSVVVLAHNSEHENAEEQLQAKFQGEGLEIGFNVGYLLDPLSVVPADEIEVEFTDGNGSCVIHGLSDERSRHVVMPMRL
ncbi:MAG: DNA polymerase III subunit beta [Pseudomonadota bacterium]|nr:DNA polymerase III subunit beta [Pseudomonadota bacterium]